MPLLDIELEENVKDTSQTAEEFIQELENEIEQEKFEYVLDKCKILEDYKSEIYQERVDMFKKYCTEKNVEEIYYVYEIGSENCDVLKCVNGNICKSSISKEELPENIEIGSALIKQDTEYVIDEDVTKELENKMEKIVNRIWKKQERAIEKNRINNHEYEITGNLEETFKMKDITSGNTFLETKNLEDIVFKFENGKYKIYAYGDKIIDNSEGQAKEVQEESAGIWDKLREFKEYIVESIKKSEFVENFIEYVKRMGEK